MSRTSTSQRHKTRSTKKKRNLSRTRAEVRNAVSHTNAEQISKRLNWLLPGDLLFADLKFHGNTSWLPRTLASLALCWAWAENRCLTDSFTYAAGWMQTLAGEGMVLTTYQGMMNALTKWTPSLLPILQQRFQRLMKQIGKDRWAVGDWVAIAFDGSRDAAPRTKSNERAYCAADYGNGKTARSKKNRNGKTKKGTRTGKVQPPAPHVWITLMWHVGLRLPWTWRLGPSNTSERTHVMQMIEEETFPENTLFCGDAGFVGYELWALILKRKFEFLVRVGGNVRLLVERGNVVLKSNMTVLSWPEHAVQAQQTPLRLRLVRVKIGRTEMWLLTSVMDKSKLSLDQIRELYKQRWGIEVEFRGLKQTLDKGKLRCRNSDRVAVELHWSLICMAGAELAALKEQLAGRRNSDSHRKSKGQTMLNHEESSCRSLAESVRAIRYALSNLHDTPPANETLTARLKRAVVVRSPGDARSKRARYRPPNEDHNKPLGTPKLRLLKDIEKKKLKMLRQDKLSI